MDERYGKAESQKIKDTQWVEEASLAGDVLLCKDLAIAHNALEAQVIYMSSARVDETVVSRVLMLPRSFRC